LARILITVRSLVGTRDAPYLQILQSAGHEAVFAQIPSSYLTNEQLLHQLEGIDGVVASSEPYTRATFERYPELRVIARTGVGYDAIDLQAAADHHVVVMIAAGTNDSTVAETAVAAMLNLTRELPMYYRRAAEGNWARETPPTELRGKTVGLIGLGRIGRAVAQRLGGFDVALIAAELYPDPAFVAAQGIALTEVDGVFRRADIVSLHVPLSDATRNLVNRTRLALMKPSAFLVNTARGGLVEEDALYEALAARRIAGAALDVRIKEPPSDPRLAQLPNVLPTPHIAGVSRESIARMSQVAARNVVDVLAGAWDRGMVVNGVFAA